MQDDNRPLTRAELLAIDKPIGGVVIYAEGNGMVTIQGFCDDDADARARASKAMLVISDDVRFNRGENASEAMALKRTVDFFSELSQESSAFAAARAMLSAIAGTAPNEGVNEFEAAIIDLFKGVVKTEFGMRRKHGKGLFDICGYEVNPS